MSPRSRHIRPFSYLFNVSGMDEGRGPFFVNPSHAERIENMHQTQQGTFTAYRQGYQALASNLGGGNPIDSLIWHRSTGGENKLLAAVDGKILHMNTTQGIVTETVCTLNTSGNSVSSKSFKGTLFLAEQTMAAQKWSGSGLTTAAGGFPIGSDNLAKPRLVETHGNRLVWGAFNGFPSHIALSDILAPETFTLGTHDADGIVVEVSPGDGQSLVAMTSLNIPVSNDTVLILWKERSIYALEGNTPSTFNLIKLNDSIGALNNRCVVQVGSDTYFMDENNIYSLTTANSSGSIQPNIIGSQQVRETLKKLNRSASDRAWAIHLPDRSEVWFAIPTGANTIADTILVYRYPDTIQQHHVWTLRTGMAMECGLRFNGEFLTGDNSGTIHRWFGTTLHNGDGVPWRYRYPFWHFDKPHRQKRILELFAWFHMAGNADITIQSQWRGGGGDSIPQPITQTVSPGNGGSIYGNQSYYGQDYYADPPLRKVKIPVLGSGEQFRIEVSGTAGSTAPMFLGISGLVEFSDYSRDYR